MAADALLARGGLLARAGADDARALAQALPPSRSIANPVDVLGDAPPERFGRPSQAVLADPGVDAVLAILTPQAMTDPTRRAAARWCAAAAAAQAVLAAWMGGPRSRRAASVFEQAGVAGYASPEQAVDAFMHLVAYARNLETLHETPRRIPSLRA